MDNWKKAKQLYRQMIVNFCFLLNNKIATKITNMQTNKILDGKYTGPWMVIRG